MFTTAANGRIRNSCTKADLRSPTLRVEKTLLELPAWIEPMSLRRLLVGYGSLGSTYLLTAG